jgi:hypothetical protein
VSETRDELLSRILAVVEGPCERVEKLEEAQVESATEAAELLADHEVMVTGQDEINDLFAQRLGGRLVEVRPPPGPPDLRLVVDNDNHISPEGA